MLETSLDVTPGQAHVKFSLTVSNTGESEETLSFRDGKRADFAVYDEEEEIWRWSDGRMFTQALAEDTIRPGNALNYEGDWEDPPEGSYRVVAELAAEDRDDALEAEFSV